MKKRKNESAFFSLRALLITLACGASILTGTLPASFPSDTPKDSQRTLTFAERLAYQRAIEEVYWRHRNWPRDRTDPKPSLDAVMSQAQLEKKVADYLRKSQALEDYWQRPITAEQLQAEMDRMAEHTKNPEILRELFEAVGNDPFVIAECLARPVLAERLTADLLFRVETTSLEPPAVDALPSPLAVPAVGNAPYNLPPISEGHRQCADDTWAATSIFGAPFGRIAHTAVWTGTEMIVWGGYVQFHTVNDGGSYNPATDSWMATNTINAPSERALHTAVWTGTEMVVWGGGRVILGEPLNSGGRYDPIADSWTASSTSNAPLARYGHTAVWTGSEVIVWGGHNVIQLNTGGRYNPNADRWTETDTSNAPSAREEHTAVWTGSEMIVWGGYLFDGGGSHFLDTGGRYNPATNSWIATNETNAPTGRRLHTAVWTGNEMIVWGGEAGLGEYLNSGGRYNVSADTWIATSTNDAPSPRESHTAIWSGSEMIVWDGFGTSTDLKTDERYRRQSESQRGESDGTIRGNTPTPTPTPTAPSPPNTPTPTPTPIPTPPIPGSGGRYNPRTDSWTDISTANAPSVRNGHTSIWTGNEMVVWGGSDFNAYLKTGGKYCAQTDPTPRPRPTPHPRR